MRHHFLAILLHNLTHLIEEGHLDDLIKGLRPHCACIHAHTATHISWDALHPLEPTNTGSLCGTGYLLEASAHSAANALLI